MRIESQVHSETKMVPQVTKTIQISLELTESEARRMADQLVYSAYRSLSYGLADLPKTTNEHIADHIYSVLKDAK